MQSSSFADLFAANVRAASPRPRPLAPGECRSSNGVACGLCNAMTLTYETEARLKAEAAARFWSAVAGNVPLGPLVLSPRGRGYRTVSKRKAFRSRGTIRLGLIGPAEDPRTHGITVARCAIEPEFHAEIYQVIDEGLQERSMLPLANVLQYVIIKGNYLEQSILFNVRGISPEVVRSVNHLSRKITAQFGDRIAGVFLFEGETEGRYYLASRDAGAVPRIRKVFGRSRLFVRIEGRPFLYPPLAFSQVNESLLDLFVGGVRTLLTPANTETLLDLYCGYGLFALSLAPQVRSVIGAETSHLAVAAAEENAHLQKVSQARFVRAHLDSASVRTVTAKAPPGTLMILDPPRNGTAPGVIEALAERQPRKVVHIFCNMEVLAAELLRWRKAGYQTEQAIPFDMFPGTAELEIMVLLTPGAHLES